MSPPGPNRFFFRTREEVRPYFIYLGFSEKILSALNAEEWQGLCSAMAYNYSYPSELAIDRKLSERTAEKPPICSNLTNFIHVFSQLPDNIFNKLKGSLPSVEKVIVDTTHLHHRLTPIAVKKEMDRLHIIAANAYEMEIINGGKISREIMGWGIKMLTLAFCLKKKNVVIQENWFGHIASYFSNNDYINAKIGRSQPLGLNISTYFGEPKIKKVKKNHDNELFYSGETSESIPNAKETSKIQTTPTNPRRP